MIKIVMRLQNPHVKLEAVPAEIPLEAKKWEKVPSVPRYAGVR